ncbi:LysR family transcriptional regulator ArgP [Comamonas sp.]|uniref:LysR family transcriptional regulator ArgP n=1 Tax=Comamonas sp. TaxID=34028 RepID=UPI0028A209E1|nr:LysR family transcriptional regulator ArgP [Comamonas sp.]
MSNLDPVALECLAAVIEEGGFEKAALRLNVTQSAVSQRLRALEAQIGSVLVVRSRPLRPTAAGQLLLKHTQQLRLLRTDLEQELHSLLPHTQRRNAHDEAISIAINADSIATWALDALQDIALQQLPLEIITDDQDHTLELLRTGEVLGCVTTMPRALRGCRVTALGAMHYIAVASPAFAEQHVPQGINRSNFKHLPFLSYNRKDDMQRVFVARAMGLKTVGLHQLYVPNSEAQVRAVAAGWGVGVVPELLARPYLADGRLVNVAEAQVLRVDLFWHCWNLQSALLSALSDAMVHSAKGSLAPPTAAARATVKA